MLLFIPHPLLGPHAYTEGLLTRTDREDSTHILDTSCSSAVFWVGAVRWYLVALHLYSMVLHYYRTGQSSYLTALSQSTPCARLLTGSKQLSGNIDIAYLGLSAYAAYRLTLRISTIQILQLLEKFEFYKFIQLRMPPARGSNSVCQILRQTVYHLTRTGTVDRIRRTE